MLHVKDLIQPFFVVGGKKKIQSIPSFPGVKRFSVDELVREVARARKLGIKSVLLFGVPTDATKDVCGLSSYAGEPLVARAVKALKVAFPSLEVMTDVCLCAYTTHGHCGLLKSPKSPVIDAAKTCQALAAMAVAHARAGADWVAPSAMCDGQVKAIRQGLDKAGFKSVKIMGYSAKFASSFYGPFRSAAKSAPAFGDRTGYQLPWDDDVLALKKIAQDIAEGADMVMVKPALCYLDIIRRAKEQFKVPVAAYNTSGEFSLVAIGSKAGAGDRQMMVLELMTALKRAGTSRIITYHAMEVAGYLRSN